MAVSAVAISVIVRNSTIEALFPGGLASFARSCPNQTYCTDGTVSRVGFMTTIDARTFICQLVTAGLASSVAKAHSEIALVAQGQGFIDPCDWLQLGLFDGHSCVWLANTDRGNLSIPRSELKSDPNSRIVTFRTEELNATCEFVGLREDGKVEVYRNKKTGEFLYIGRPLQLQPVRKWWQIWKRSGQLPVDASTHDQMFAGAWDLIKPYIQYQLADAPLDRASRKQLYRACEMLGRIIQFNPSNWEALWAAGIANKCLRQLGPAYTAFRRAYALEKENPSVGRELSGICIALGKGEEAVRISRELMDRNPKDVGLISNHALALLVAGRIEAAAAAVENALRLEPGDRITENLAKFITAVRTNQVAWPDRWPPTKRFTISRGIKS